MHIFGEHAKFLFSEMILEKSQLCLLFQFLSVSQSNLSYLEFFQVQSIVLIQCVKHQTYTEFVFSIS